MSSQLIVSQKKDYATRSIVDMTGANSIFGTLGRGAWPILSRMGFIPEDNAGNTISLTGEGDSGTAKWIGLDTPIMQFWAYVYCSPLAGVIDRLAEADTNGKIKFINEETGVPLKNVNKIPKLLRIKRLLKRPNPWQTWEQFDAEQVVLCKIFGCCPVWAIGPGLEDKSYTSAFVNLNRAMVTPVANTEFNFFDAIKSSKKVSKIKEWLLNVFGNTYTIPSSEIILIVDGFVSKTTDDLGLPLSKINGMDFAISNICAAMEADNVILKKKGPLGVFSFNPGKDMAGTTPYDPAAKDALQEDLRRYGLTIGQIQYIVSKLPVQFHAMSFNLRDLMTKETIRSGIDFICDRFGYPAELMSGKNATYENRNSSERWLYNNNVIPHSIRRMTIYNDFFQLEDIVLMKDYDDLPVLQEDIVKAGEASRNEAEALQIEWESGMITWNEWRIAKGRDPVAGMDIYYPEYIKEFPLMNKTKTVKNGEEASPKDTGAKE